MEVYDLISVGHGEPSGVSGPAGQDPSGLECPDEGVHALLDRHLHVGEAELCGKRGEKQVEKHTYILEAEREGERQQTGSRNGR